MFTVQVSASLAADPIIATSTKPSCTNTTAAHILTNIQCNISVSGTITNVNSGVHFEKIFKRHPKRSILCINKIQLLLNVWVLLPHVALVRPITLPFKCTPWITKLNKFKLLRFRQTNLISNISIDLNITISNFHAIIHFQRLNQTVRMAGHQTLLLQHLLSIRTTMIIIVRFCNTRRHERLLQIILFQQNPNLLLCKGLFRLSKAACTSIFGIFQTNQILTKERPISIP
mmetsp:Transcript_10502/g.14722  ORF Transcript_10502/g.14722 Transcript_10502/m.14722 type:complete len:230 (+) Transcript_10502:406-1095(+)